MTALGRRGGVQSRSCRGEGREQRGASANVGSDTGGCQNRWPGVRSGVVAAAELPRMVGSSPRPETPSWIYRRFLSDASCRRSAVVVLALASLAATPARACRRAGRRAAAAVREPQVLLEGHSARLTARHHARLHVRARREVRSIATSRSPRRSLTGARDCVPVSRTRWRSRRRGSCWDDGHAEPRDARGGAAAARGGSGQLRDLSSRLAGSGDDRDGVRRRDRQVRDRHGDRALPEAARDDGERPIRLQRGAGQRARAVAGATRARRMRRSRCSR